MEQAIDHLEEKTGIVTVCLQEFSDFSQETSGA